MHPHTMQTTAFRRPIPPEPVEVFDLPHPAVPRGEFSSGAGLEGLRILHLSDLHIRRRATGSDRFRQLLDAVSRTPADLVVLTGDYTDEPGHENAAMDALRALAHAWPPPRLGAFGIFGNHDTSALKRRAPAIAGITWLCGPDRRRNGRALARACDWSGSIIPRTSSPRCSMRPRRPIRPS